MWLEHGIVLTCLTGNINSKLSCCGNFVTTFNFPVTQFPNLYNEGNNKTLGTI